MIYKWAIVFCATVVLQGAICTASAEDDSKRNVAVEKKTKKKGKITFEGGDGSSMEKAVVILGAKDSMEGISAEYDYIKKHFRGYETTQQGLLNKDGKYYDQITLGKGKKEIVIFFDITDFFAKNKN